MTFLLEIIRLGLKNLQLHMLRSILTSLGIILGVAAVIIMVSIGEGNKQAAMRAIQALGATNVIVRSSKPPEAGSFTAEERGLVVTYGLLQEDLRRIRHYLKDAAYVVPLKAAGGEISYQSQRLTSQTFGTTPELKAVANLRLESRGRYITQEDLRASSAVAVIGAEIATKFFRLQDPLGKVIRIDQQPYRIVGVLKPIGLAGGASSPLVGRDWNKDVHIPLTSAANQFGDVVIKRASGSFSGERVELAEIYITARTTDMVKQTAERVKRLLQVGHPDFNDVEVIVPWELLEQVKKTQMVWNLVFIAVAAISLLVGGIGIMNIMLASVTERIREIGIRRALGATRKHIVAQFLVETGSLTMVGGLVGILVGVGVSIGLDRLLPWVLSLDIVRQFYDVTVTFETQLTTWSIVISFLVATVVGLVFGIYPAIIASRQDPIEALRHD